MKRWSILRGGTITVALSLCLAACGESDDPAAAPTATASVVTRSERVWVDTTRPTAPNGSYAGAPDRTLRTLIWQPANREPMPLFVMAHGFGGLPEDFEAMAHTIADAGFVVAAPAFPLTNLNAPGGWSHALQDVAHQPADVSFVISKLLEANAGANDPLRGRITTNDIAVLGHSLGAATVIALTRKDCCRDTRVRASIPFAAAPPLALLVNLFGTDPISTGPPTLVLSGTADALTYVPSQMLYSQIDPPKFFVGITGAGHVDAILEAQTAPLTSLQSVSARAIVAFLNAMFHGASTELSSTLATLAAEGNPVESDGTLP